MSSTVDQRAIISRSSLMKSLDGVSPHRQALSGSSSLQDLWMPTPSHRIRGIELVSWGEFTHGTYSWGGLINPLFIAQIRGLGWLCTPLWTIINHLAVVARGKQTLFFHQPMGIWDIHGFNRQFFDVLTHAETFYPLVIQHSELENCHWNPELSNSKWWIFPQLCELPIRVSPPWVPPFHHTPPARSPSWALQLAPTRLAKPSAGNCNLSARNSQRRVGIPAKKKTCYILKYFKAKSWWIQTFFGWVEIWVKLCYNSHNGNVGPCAVEF